MRSHATFVKLVFIRTYNVKLTTLHLSWPKLDLDQGKVSSSGIKSDVQSNASIRIPES